MASGKIIGWQFRWNNCVSEDSYEETFDTLNACKDDVRAFFKDSLDDEEMVEMESLIANWDGQKRLDVDPDGDLLWGLDEYNVFSIKPLRAK